MSVRSTTDETLAARFDPYPWRVEVIDRTDMDLRAARDGERLSDPAWTAFWDASTERLVFDPRPEYARPEYARPEPNPILVAFRQETDRTVAQASYWADSLTRYRGDEPWSAGDYMDALEDVLDAGCTPAQIEDARKVLTRLVNVYGGE